jgi:hypothetical protein
MIVILKNNCRIVGFTPIVWQAIASERPPREPRTLARTASLQAAFEAALSEGLVEPGKPLDLSGFNCFIRDTARRFDQADAVRLSDGYAAELAGQAGGREWMVSRDTGRGGKHAVRVASAADVAGALSAAVWHAAFRQRQMLTAPEVGPYLTSIAHGLLDGATAASGVASNEGAQTR